MKYWKCIEQFSYFGNGVWGIQDASLKYFGVNASDLTVGEAATLVGMLKGPSIYNSYRSSRKCDENRRDTVSRTEWWTTKCWINLWPIKKSKFHS